MMLVQFLIICTIESSLYFFHTKVHEMLIMTADVGPLEIGSGLLNKKL